MRAWHKAEKDEVARSMGYPDFHHAVTRLYREGHSASQIGAIFGMTGEGIRHALIKLKQPMRGRGGKNHVRHKE